MNHCVADIRQHLAVSHRETGPVLKEASALFAQKREVETKQALLNAFQKHFILSDDEYEHLTSLSSGVDEHFFALLYRLKRIHADCQVLLGAENQQLGLELMEQSSRQLEAAYQKLSRWIQGVFKTLDLENPRMSQPIRQALRVLAERPQLFQDCLNFFAEARERSLSDAFYAALTGSSTQTSDQTTKPMEYYAHDALRFTGDMLAWTHSAAVSERESLEVLFIAEGDEMAKGIQAGIENEPWLRGDNDAFDGKKSLELLVNRDLAGVSKALNTRMEQVVKSDEDPVSAYQIANLIAFYCTTFSRLLGSQSLILEMLMTCQESALSQYRANTRDLTNTISFGAVAAPADEDVPDFLSEALTSLSKLLKSCDASYSSVESRDDNFRIVIAESLDPYLDICDNMAAQIEEPGNSVFVINCLLASKATLAPWGSASDRIAAIDDQLDESTAKLIDYQHAFLLQTSGVHPLLGALAPLTNSDEDVKSIRGLEAFQADALRESSEILDDFLPSASIDAAENLKRLKEKRMVEDITGEAALRFCEDFEQLESRLAAVDSLEKAGLENHQADESQKPAQLKALYPRTSGEIRVLLS